MPQAGTAWIPFEGDFSNVMRDARRYGERAGGVFGGDFGDRADRAVGSSFKSTGTGLARDSRRYGDKAGDSFSRGFGNQSERSVLGSFKKMAAGAAVVFAGAKVKSLFGDMISEAREAAKVGRITENAIRATGGAAKVSAADVGELSTALSNKAGIDDELIQTGANLLLTFKKVRNEVGEGNQIFDRATAAAVDLSVQFGSVDSTSKMLGKALNDPLKGLTALGRAGVTFTDEQKQMITAMVGANDTLGAQKIILGEVEAQVGGAAAAAADPLDRLNVAWGNLLEQAGAKILPWVSGIAEGLADKLPGAIAMVEEKFSDLWATGSEMARSLWTLVAPAAEDVVDHLGNLRDIGEEVVEAARPIAEVLLVIGGGAVIGGLRANAAALEAVSGFLADHEGIVTAVAIAYAAWKGAVIAQATWTAIGTGVGLLSVKFDMLAISAYNALGAVTAAQAAAGGIAGIAIGAATAFMSLERSADHGQQAAERFLSTLDIDDNNSLSITAAIADINAQMGELEELVDDHSTWDRFWERINPRDENTVDEAVAKMKRLGAETEGLAARADKLFDVGRALSLSANAVEHWVEKFDLDPAILSSEAMTKAIKTNLEDLAKEAGFRGPQILAALELSPEEMEAQKAQWEELSQAVSGAWASQLDVVGSLGGQADLTAEKIRVWYEMQASQATTFGQNVATAIQQGYDPALISRLLQAGPAQAAPMLQAMVDGHKNGLVDIVNQGEKALSRLSTLAVEMARIQNMAMNAQTDDMTRNMGAGLKVAEAVSRLGAFATADAIAHELHMGAGRVANIAELYGITLASAVNPVLNAVGKKPITITASGGLSRSIASLGFNTGGWVPGPNVDRDVVPAMLTPGEVVVNKDMTDKWGASNLLALNAGKLPPGWSIPGYNAGGRVTGDLQGMHPELLRRLQMWAGAVGQTYHVGSGYRSVAEQVPLYQKYLAGRGPVAAVPGSSMHNYGLASDGNHWRSKNPGAFDLSFAVPSEAWHVQPVDARALKGGSSHGFIPPVSLPKPPPIGPWALAQGGEGSMDLAYRSALEWAQAQMMSYGDPGMGSIASGSAREIGQRMAAARGWTGSQWSALDRLWNRESGWRVDADNPTSSAYGIPQSLPGSKMASHGADWRTNAATQIAWGLDYIAGRYGSPVGAWAHSERVGWYNDGGEVFRHRRSFDSGGVLEEGWNMVRNDTGAPEPLVPAGRGPAVHIEHAEFSEPVDVDVIIQKASFAQMAGVL